MIAVPVLAVLAVVTGVTLFLIGRANTRARAAEKRLGRAETLIDTLQADAAEHVALDDNFARIVLDEIRQYKTTEWQRIMRKELK